MVRSRSIIRDIHLFHYLLTSADIKSCGLFVYLCGPLADYPRTIANLLQTTRGSSADHSRIIRRLPAVHPQTTRGSSANHSQTTERSQTSADICGRSRIILRSFAYISRRSRIIKGCLLMLVDHSQTFAACSLIGHGHYMGLVSQILPLLS